MSEKPKEKNEALTGVNFGTKEFLLSAKSRAFSLNMSLSKYLAELIRRDLETKGPFVIGERPSPNAEADAAALRAARAATKKPSKQPKP